MSDSVHVWVYLHVYIVSLTVPVPVELCNPHAPACPLWLTGVAGLLLSCCLELIWRAGGVFSQTDCLIPVCVEGGRDRHPRVCLFKPLLFFCFFLPPSIKCNVKNLGSNAKRGKWSFQDIRLQTAAAEIQCVGDGEMESCGRVVLLLRLCVYVSKSWISTGCGLPGLE